MAKESKRKERSQLTARILGIAEYKDGAIAWSIWDGCPEAFICRGRSAYDATSLLLELLDRRGVYHRHLSDANHLAGPLPQLDKLMPVSWEKGV